MPGKTKAARKGTKRLRARTSRTGHRKYAARKASADHGSQKENSTDTVLGMFVDTYRSL